MILSVSVLNAFVMIV